MRDYSFIIVSWNAKAYLRQCLDSIVTESKGLDIEVIIVDNASSDGSPEMVQAEYPWVVLIRNDSNVGFARANNQGIAISSARYLCLLNSDVVIHPGCLVQMRDFLDANPQIGLAGPKVLNSDGTLQSSCREAPTLRSVLFRALALDTLFSRSSTFGAHFMTNWDHDDVRVVDILSGCCWFARRLAVQEVGGLNEAFFMYGEDMEWSLRFGRKGWSVAFNPVATITHYGGASSSRQPTRFFIEMQRADLQYWRMHHGAAAFITYYVVVVLGHACRVAGHSVLWLVRPSGRAQSAAKVEGSVACLVRLLTLQLTAASHPQRSAPPSVRRTGMTKAEPHYSLVTAFRNEKNWLADLVRSIEAQSIKPTTWVLVDDGSTDDSLDHARSLTRHLPFVEIVALVDTGTRNFASQVYAQLAGVERLEARMPAYLGFLDADIVVPPDYYETMLERFRSNPRLASRAGTCSTRSENRSSTHGLVATTTTYQEESSYSEPSATNRLEVTYQSRVAGRTSWSRRPP